MKNSLSREEKFLLRMQREEENRAKKEQKILEKQKRIEDREQKKLLKQKEKEEQQALRELQKQQPDEAKLVRDYVKRVIANSAYHGRIDTSKFKGLEYKTNTKALWRDTDFYFCVVFQSREQKYEFLEKLKPDVEDDSQIQIVNGLLLAKQLGIELKLESVKDYPTGDLRLRPFVLDLETT